MLNDGEREDKLIDLLDPLTRPLFEPFEFMLMELLVELLEFIESNISESGAEARESKELVDDIETDNVRSDKRFGESNKIFWQKCKEKIQEHRFLQE